MKGRNNKEGDRVDKRNGRSREDDFLSTNEKLFLRATDNERSFNAEGDEGKKCGGLATEELSAGNISCSISSSFETELELLFGYNYSFSKG